MPIHGFGSLTPLISIPLHHLQTAVELVHNAERISLNLERVGSTSIEIRNAAVTELNDVCPADPDIASTAGMDITGIAKSASTDLTKLADFISEGLLVLNENLVLVRGFTVKAMDATDGVEFWGWQMKLLAAGEFSIVESMWR